jgi:TldD protein
MQTAAGQKRRAERSFVPRPNAYIGCMSITDPRSYLYQPGLLDPDAALRVTRDALQRCDDGELYLQYSASESFGFDDGRLKLADYSTGSGFGLRGVSGEMTGFSHANDLSEAAIRRAGETLQLLDPSKSGQAPPPRQNNRHLYTDGNPLDLVPFAKKVELCQKIDAAARARDPRVAQVSATLAGSWTVVEIVRADGFIATDVRPLVRLNVSIVVEENGRRESGSYGFGGRYLYDKLFEDAEWEHAIDEALAQALVNLRSVDAPAGEMTVLLGPGWPGVLLHEAVGHGLEGDFNRKGTSAFSGKIGQRVAAPGVTVVDDGTMANRRGSLSIDDEGTPTQENILIEDGILRAYMQDRLNARLMGVEPTGNGRRQSYAHAPMPRMTNTFMKGGNDDPAELLSQKLWRRTSRYRVGQICVQLHRGVPRQKWQIGRSDQGRDADRRWPRGDEQSDRHRQRHGAGRRRWRVRQSGPKRARRGWPANNFGQRVDRGWHRRIACAMTRGAIE